MHQGQAGLNFIWREAFSCQTWRTHLQTVGQPFMRVGESGSDELGGPGETPQKGNICGPYCAVVPAVVKLK
jgi:hypothetical protein